MPFKIHRAAPAPPSPASPSSTSSAPSSPITTDKKHRYTPTLSKNSSIDNAHPYTIKTTSTALLTRSNSLTQNHVHNHYVPISPPPSSPPPSAFRRLSESSTGGTQSRISTSRTVKGTPGHRVSRSLSSASDDGGSLPSPPGEGTISRHSTGNGFYSSPGSSLSSVALATPNDDDESDLPPFFRNRFLGGRFKKGTVKGMVRSWEDRSSSSSASSSASDSEDEDAGEGTVSTIKNTRDLPTSVLSPYPAKTLSPDSATSTSIPEPIAPPPPVPMPSSSPAEEEEPSMDTLLRQHNIQPDPARLKKKKLKEKKRAKAGNNVTGVDAWLSGGMNDTVKRIGSSDDVLGATLTAGRVAKPLQALKNVFKSSSSLKSSSAPAESGSVISTIALKNVSPPPPSSSREDDLAALRLALSQTRALATSLAERVEDYEARVALMDLASMPSMPDLHESDDNDRDEEMERLRAGIRDRSMRLKKVVEEKEQLWNVLEEVAGVVWKEY